MAVRLKRKPAASEASSPRGPFYFYGVSAPTKIRVTAVGIENQGSIAAVPVSGFSCWITPVSSDFISTMERRMEDLEWLAEASVLHQRAVSAIAGKTDLLPARFGTVFLNEASLAKHITSRMKAIQAALKKVAGAEEWGVKVFVTAPVAAQGAAFSASSGGDYLRQKAKALAAQNLRRAAPDGQTEELAEALKKLSRAMAPSGTVSGAQPGLQWQASFLLPRARRKQWDTVLKRFAQRWGETRRIECTGPWPPYSFVE